MTLHTGALPTVSLLLLTTSMSSAQSQPAPDAGVVEGRVLGPLGEAMVNIEVRVAIWPEIETVVARTSTDGAGMFVLGRLPLRVLRLTASAPGHTTAFGTATLSAEQPQGAVQMRLWPANTLRGRVLDGDGKPVVGAVVLGTKDFTWFDSPFESPEMQTAADGRFELAGVPIGDCVLRAWAPGYLMREHALTAFADQDVELRLERGDGQLLAVRTIGLPPEARPRTKVRCHALRDGSGFSMPRQFEFGRLDEQGCWRIGGVPTAGWYVELTADGFTFDPRTFTTNMADPLREMVFTATANGSLQLHGVLRSFDGKPLAGERLVCRTKRSQSMNGGTPGEATTDAEGRFVMDAPLVAREPYSLHLVASRWVLEQKKSERMTGARDMRYLVRYEDEADGARELSLVAQPAALVTAKLVDDTGRPVPFAWTELQQRNDRRIPAWMAMAHATSRRDGIAVFPGVHAVADELRLQTTGSAGSGTSDAFHLERGERREFVVRVQLPGSVCGRVLDASGKPVAGYRVSIRNYDLGTGKQVDGSLSSVPTGRDGRFAFVGVAPGGHKVTNHPHEARAGSSDVFEMRPDATVELELRLDK